MAYHEDLRMAAVRHYKGSGDAFAETGKIFNVSESSVQRWATQYEATGNVSDKPLNRNFKKIDPTKLRTYVQEHPDATQQEIADAFGCCNQAVSKALKRLNIARKKTRRYKERDAEKVAEYQAELAKIPENMRVYVDETGSDSYRKNVGQHQTLAQKPYARISFF